MVKVKRSFVFVLLLAGCIYLGFFGYTKPDIVSSPSSLEMLAPSKPELLMPRKLEPLKNIFYLKVHKTGSSTMHNILSTIAIRQKKRVAVFGDVNMDRNMLKRVLNRPGNNLLEQEFNMIIGHSTYREKEVAQLLPSNRFMLGSVRDPRDHSHSYFVELKVARALDLDPKDPVSDFLERDDLTLKYAHKYSNIMIREFGITKESLKNRTEMKSFTHEILERFDLVLIKEMFNSSLVLLKRKLHLEMGDIVYLKQRVQKKQINKRYQTDPDLKEKHFQYNEADFYLYNQALERFRSEISSAGKGLLKEIEMFERIEQAFVDYCEPLVNSVLNASRSFQEIFDTTPPISLDPSPWGNPFTVDAVHCMLSKLQTEVLDSLLYLAGNRYICEDKNIRKIPINLRIRTSWEGRNAYRQNEVFCSAWNDTYNMPLKLLDMRDAYMS